MALDFLALGNSLGAIPGVDMIPGAGIVKTGFSLLTNFLKGGVPDHERGDIVAISAATGLTQQQVQDLCGMEESRSKDNYDTICKKYAGNPGAMLPLISEWNDKHPGQKIALQAEAPAPAPAMVPAVVQQMPTALMASPVPSLVPQSLAATASLGDYAKAAIGGAQKGVTDVFMQTPAGMQAKSDGAMSWAKDNLLILIAAGIGLGFLIFKAFSKK